MRVLIVLCALAAVAVSSDEFFSKKYEEADVIPANNAVIINGTFQTRVDHFNHLNQNTWTFNYNGNLDSFLSGGPFFVYIKDANDFSTQYIQSGLMVDIAKEAGAALFTFDQRFFGNNIPVNNLTLENLQTLNVEQSVADIAEFIRAIKAIHGGQYSEVYLWGSGLGATYATYARLRYPHLVQGTWSSSGYFQLNVVTHTPVEQLQWNLYTVEPECRDRVLSLFNQLDYLIEKNESEYLQSRLNLCRPVETTDFLDVGALYQTFLQSINGYINRNHITGLTNFCRDLNYQPEDVFNSFVRWVQYVYGTNQCYDHSYAGIVERHSSPELFSGAVRNGARQYYYLQCTQIGGFEVTDSISWLPNRINSTYYFNKCRDILGEEYDYSLLFDANEQLAKTFGTTNIEASNVIYTNGRLDSRFEIGMLYTSVSGSRAISIPYQGHSADLTSAAVADTQELLDAKTTIREQILLWSIGSGTVTIEPLTV